MSSLVKVNLNDVSGPVTSVQTLNQDRRRVSFKDSAKTVDVYFQVEDVLLSRLLSGVVRNVEFHEFVQTSESVPKACVFDSFFVSDDETVQSQQVLDAVDQVMPVAWNAADRVTKQCQVHDVRQGHQ